MKSAILAATALAAASAAILPSVAWNGVTQYTINNANIKLSCTPGYDLVYGTAYTASQGAKGTIAAPSKHTENIRFEAYAVFYTYLTLNLPQYFQVDYKFKFYPIYYAPLDLYVAVTRALESQAVPVVTITGKDVKRIGVLTTKVY